MLTRKSLGRFVGGAPERRTRTDLAAAAAIVVAIIVAATMIWLHSDARGTTSITARTPASIPPTALTVPEKLHEAWQAASGSTDAPLVASGAVVTGDGSTVTGRDPTTGTELWRYQRNMPLCGVTSAWGMAVAVYRDQRGCSQVTELDGASGQRRAARTSYADRSVTLSTDGTHITSQGRNRLEMWRSDMVRTLEYGYVDAPVNPNSQPRTGCTLESTASSAERLAVIERCPGDPTDRLSVLDPTPKDNTKPEQYGSTVLADIPPGASGTRVLAVFGDRVAVYLPGDGGRIPPRIAVYDSMTNPLAQYSISTALAPDAKVERAGSVYLVWTGSTIIALRETDLAPAWSALGALGPGTLMAGRILVPVANGFVTLDPATGQENGRIPLQRKNFDHKGPVMLNVVGSTVLEQRGNQVYALS